MYNYVARNGWGQRDGLFEEQWWKDNKVIKDIGVGYKCLAHRIEQHTKEIIRDKLHCLFDSESTSSWEFWSTSACTMRLLLTWWRWYYPCRTSPEGVYASFICSRRCCRAEDRECSVGSSRFLEHWALNLEQSSNWLESCKPNFQCT